MAVKSTSDVFGERPISGYQRCYNLLRDEFTTGWSTGTEGRVAGNDPVRTAEWERCKSDTAYWIDSYCYTYDPRTPGKGLPFKLWPKQVEFIHWLGRMKATAAANFAPGGSGVQLQALCEKSRDVGVSFLCAVDMLHDFLFVKGTSAAFGSRKLEYVDRLGDTKSILEKIRFMIRKLPVWMLPAGWKFGKHDMFCRIINPANGSIISGEGGDEIGRGGRVGTYVVDEAAFLERPHLVDAALIATASLRLDVSTPNGPGNPFSVKRSRLPADQVFTLHWKDDPRKGQWQARDDKGEIVATGNGHALEAPAGSRVIWPWAEETKANKGETIFASEYDINYSVSIEGITIPGEWVRAAVNFQLPMRMVNGKDAGWSSYKCSAGLDVAEEGDDLSVFIVRNGPAVRLPISWSKCNTTETAWRARDEGRAAGIKALHYDPIGVGAGAKGTLLTAEREDAIDAELRPSEIRAVKIPFSLHPVNVGEAPTDMVWSDGQTSKEKFKNLKAELWWRVRTRFEKTFEFVTKQIVHTAEDMISIPDHPQLIAELSAPLHFRAENGKIQIESKKELKKRGIKSPDFAEALILSEAEFGKKLKQFFVR